MLILILYRYNIIDNENLRRKCRMIFQQFKQRNPVLEDSMNRDCQLVRPLHEASPFYTGYVEGPAVLTLMKNSRELCDHVVRNGGCRCGTLVAIGGQPLATMKETTLTTAQLRKTDPKQRPRNGFRTGKRLPSIRDEIRRPSNWRKKIRTILPLTLCRLDKEIDEQNWMLGSLSTSNMKKPWQTQSLADPNKNTKHRSRSGFCLVLALTSTLAVSESRRRKLIHR